MLDSLSLSSSQRQTLEEVTAASEPHLYLAQKFLSARGIESEGVARLYRLGVCPDGVTGFERFRGMLSIPFLSPAGVLAIKFRCLACWPGKCEDHPKYNAPEGQQVRLYNVAALHSDGDVVAICEGELDAMVMTELVGTPAAGVPGATQWKGHPWWARAFADYERVLVVADNDQKEDGSNPGLKAAKTIAATIPGSRVVTPPAGLDVTEWVQRDGVEAVRNACGA